MNCIKLLENNPSPTNLQVLMYYSLEFLVSRMCPGIVHAERTEINYFRSQDNTAHVLCLHQEQTIFIKMPTLRFYDQLAESRFSAPANQQ